MRLCIVSPYQDGGGAEYQINLLIRALIQERRFDIHHLVHHTSAAIQPEGYSVVAIGRTADMPSFGYVADCFPLYRALREFRPNVIYQRVACGYTGISAYYARRHNARFIWHVSHDTDVMPKTLDTGRNLLRRRLEKWSIELGIHAADHIVVQTEQQRDLLWRHYRRRATEVVANFHAEAHETIDKSGPPTVVWVANLKPWKRPEIFVRLASRLRDLADVQFIMVGEAPSGSKHRQWLDSLLNSFAVTPNLRFLGRQTQGEVNRILARATVLVNTSMHEGFPNTFIQAWSRDAAVVSLEVNPDSIFDVERVGIHAGNEEQLVRAVRALLTDPALRASYVERARNHVRAKHSLRNALRLVQLIEGCAGPDHALAGEQHQC